MKWKKGETESIVVCIRNWNEREMRKKPMRRTAEGPNVVLLLSILGPITKPNY